MNKLHSNGHDPWGDMNKKKPSGPGGYSSQGNFEDAIRNAGNRWKEKMPRRFRTGRGIVLLIAGVVVLWLATGFYRVEQGRLGIELIFGKQWGALTQPGLNYNFPAPIGEVIIPNVDQSRKTEIGYREIGIGTTSNRRPVPEESLMLTGDQNIVDVEFAVFWKIKDPEAFIFNIRDPELSVKRSAESAMREVIGLSRFDNVVTEEKTIVSTRAEQVLQDFLDSLNIGVLIEKVDFQKTEPPEQVIDAFNDVQRARQDYDRFVNEGEAYSNRVLPEARAAAATIIREAEGYRESIINRAQGEADRYSEVYRSYLVSPVVTRKRMYLEMVGSILANNDKIIIDQSSGSGVLPILPLGDLKGLLGETTETEDK